MEFEICFLNKGGLPSCTMRASFLEANHAVQYARNVIETARGRRTLRAAEVFQDGQPCARVAMARTNDPRYGFRARVTSQML